eukprot:1176310-Prorocentrum_minimum.AAC.2
MGRDVREDLGSRPASAYPFRLRAKIFCQMLGSARNDNIASYALFPYLILAILCFTLSADALNGATFLQKATFASGEFHDAEQSWGCMPVGCNACFFRYYVVKRFCSNRGGVEKPVPSMRAWHRTALHFAVRTALYLRGPHAQILLQLRWLFCISRGVKRTRVGYISIVQWRSPHATPKSPVKAHMWCNTAESVLMIWLGDQDLMVGIVVDGSTLAQMLKQSK